MGAVRQAVLEFDEEVQAPWRPRLVTVVDAGDAEAARALRPHPSRRSPSRVGACRPVEPLARPGLSAQRRTRGNRAHVSRAVASPARPASGRRAPSGRPGARRVRLTRRARRIAVVLALAAGVALGSWVGPLLSGGGGDLRLAGVNSVVVQSGDTLWSIASSLDGDADVRAVVYRIQQLNALEGADLVPGQVLVLP
jgi:nucleoid-associated protein YgaU